MIAIGIPIATIKKLAALKKHSLGEHWAWREKEQGHESSYGWVAQDGRQVWLGSIPTLILDSPSV